MAQLRALHETVAAQRERQMSELVELEKDKHAQEMGQAKALLESALAAKTTQQHEAIEAARRQAARRGASSSSGGVVSSK